MGDGFALPRFKQGVFAQIWQVGWINPWAGPLQMAQFAQFFGGHGNLMRATTAENNNPLQLGSHQCIKRRTDNITAIKFRPGLGQNPRDIERDIAIADDHGGLAAKIRIEARKLRMAIIPADKGGTAEHIAQAFAGKAGGFIIGRAGGQHHRVIQPLKLGNCNIPANHNIADKPDCIGQRHRLIPPRDPLDRLMIGGNPATDQPIGHRQQIKNINPDIVAPLLLRGLGGVIARRTRSDNRDMPHAVPPYLKLLLKLSRIFRLVQAKSVLSTRAT